ncbi:MAG TPA: ubiquinol-cytochrome c reductase iron-sulfur subunit [Gemmataceae bacterium]|jgi:Rieske Fe-S protein|nr:ubiquinol-cytochrome c reductase iron-sulfur subunit [Gemmataceae bacterium]
MSSSGPNRRRFLDFLTKAVLAVIGLCLTIPGVAYFWAPLRRKGGGADGPGPDFLPVGPLSDSLVGQWSLRSVEVVRADGWKKSRVRHAVWVRRQGEGESGITVLSSICPHLGCPVNWHPDRKEFMCPCHGGVFHADGRQVGGPPPRSMDSLDFEVRAGQLWVRWQDFKIGTGERIPVNA